MRRLQGGLTSHHSLNGLDYNADSQLSHATRGSRDNNTFLKHIVN